MKIEEHPAVKDQTLQANRDFLYQAVDTYHQVQKLQAGVGNIELCKQFFSGVQVFKGIEQLAQAAGKVPHTVRTGIEDYSFETSFEFCGVRFYQLKEDDKNEII